MRCPGAYFQRIPSTQLCDPILQNTMSAIASAVSRQSRPFSDKPSTARACCKKLGKNTGREERWAPVSTYMHALFVSFHGLWTVQAELHACQAVRARCPGRARASGEDYTHVPAPAAALTFFRHDCKAFQWRRCGAGRHLMRQLPAGGSQTRRRLPRYRT